MGNQEIIMTFSLSPNWWQLFCIPIHKHYLTHYPWHWLYRISINLTLHCIFRNRSLILQKAVNAVIRRTSYLWMERNWKKGYKHIILVSCTGLTMRSNPKYPLQRMKVIRLLKYLQRSETDKHLLKCSPDQALRGDVSGPRIGILKSSTVQSPQPLSKGPTKLLKECQLPACLPTNIDHLLNTRVMRGGSGSHCSLGGPIG